MTDAVHTPNPEQERPRAVAALATAAVCFALGVAAVVTLTRPVHDTVPALAQTNPAAQTKQTTQAKQASPPTAPPITPTPSANKQPDREPALVAAAASPAPPPPAPESISAKTTTKAPELNLIQGRVAYLRCDGLSGERGRFPCPRDTALERAVWDVLSGLPACAPSLGRGGSDIRLDISRGQRTEAHVVAVAGAPEPSLDPLAVHACIGSQLGRLKTSLDPIYMMISFRFSLR